MQTTIEKTMKLIDNKTTLLGDDIKAELKSGSQLAIAASCFSIYAYGALKKELEKIDKMRFIFTSPTFVHSNKNKQQREFFIPKLNREQAICGSEFEVKLRNELTQKAIAKECAEWIKKKARFKSNATQEVMMGFINADQKSYMPINGFTTVDLGYEQGNNAYTMIQKTEVPMAQLYLQLFDDLWKNQEKLKDVTDTVIDNITNAYKENAPEFLYFVALYNIFKEFLEDITEDELPNADTGFRNSVVWNKLYNFQSDAALAIINKLERYNGCILADSVGLGKTFTALAVIKYYESRNKTVLVLCPKKLYANWDTYRQNYTNNPLSADRLNYKILYHTDLSREEGRSNDLDLERLNWGNFDFVVIDESHNFRNGGKITYDANGIEKRENRYLKLMNRIIRTGVKTKVLMLSATPVNNKFSDLKNQLELAYEGNSKAIDEKLPEDMDKVDTIFRKAQAAYTAWTQLEPIDRSTERLLQSLDFDFFRLLDAVTIARSRKHIQKYYNTEKIGRFPTRRKPINRTPQLTDIDHAINYKEIYAELNSLNLAVYAPSKYILASRLHKYDGGHKKGGEHRLSLAEREVGIQKLMTIQLLKRLESSVNSFRLSLKRINGLMGGAIDAIDEYQTTQHDRGVDDYTEVDFQEDDEGDNWMVGKKKNQISLSDMDFVRWKDDIEKDRQVLALILTLLESITPEHDSKLQQLQTDIEEKLAHPINEGNKKVIVFTAFADTALYLYNYLSQYMLQHHGLHTALISGTVEARSTLKIEGKQDFNKVLTLFSPRSKEAKEVGLHSNEWIDLLIATDCISEGQNLQDCDCLINYDIHWNPVRIIQRFGRIDRIGSKNEVIQLYNYWPDMTLDEYIHLKGRVEARMEIVNLSSTGDDNVIAANERSELEYRKNQLERLKEEVVDLEEMNGGINITDLGLNEFRLDLVDYMAQHPEVKKTPKGVHAVVDGKGEDSGVIFVLKNRVENMDVKHKNQIYPFYMVFVNEQGEVLINHLSPKALLDRMRYYCKGEGEADMACCKWFNAATNDGLDMQRYSDLLGQAIGSVIEVNDDSGLDLFFQGSEGDVLMNECSGIDDFELICFLVIK